MDKRVRHYSEHYASTYLRNCPLFFLHPVIIATNGASFAYVSESSTDVYDNAQLAWIKATRYSDSVLRFTVKLPQYFAIGI